MKKIVSLTAILFFIISYASSQTQPIEMPEKGYRFQHRIKGPEYKKSRILEIMIDEFGNYLVATYRGEKSSYVYLYIYNLYTWEEKYKIKLNDNRCELYNSTFDESGDFFYVNYDIYRNKFKEINLRTEEIREVECTETPKGCRKIEPQIYKVDGYTIGDNYYIYRDTKFDNYMKILVKKQMYIPKSQDGEEQANFSEKTGGVIQLSPAQIRELRAGIEVPYKGIPIFYDANGVNGAGKKTPYKPDEGNFKIRLTNIDLEQLDKKVSFLYGKFVIKLDIAAYEEEKSNNK